MNASTATRRSAGRQLVAATLTAGVSSGLAATLLMATMAISTAAPTRTDGQGGGSGPVDKGHLVEVACFTTPHDWDVALEGPLPRCHRSVR
jgi:hypothetical protein